MTIREVNPEFRLARANPMVTHRYYEAVVKSEPRQWMLEAWDLVIGLKDLESCISILKKAINRQNGIPEPEEKEKEPVHYCYMDLD